MYIRTEDNIYRVASNLMLATSPMKYAILDKKEDIIIGYISETRVINQADTIEELCDFVDILYNDGSWETYSFEKEFRCKLLFKKAKKVFYGIRTNQGLIYVAQRDDEGGTELL